MANAAQLRVQDTVAAAEAECYATINGQRINMMHAINCEATYEKSKKEVPILGRVSKANKAVGGKGSGKMTVHYVTSRMRALMINYIKTGRDIYFDMQITNEDPTSSVGRQTVILKDCNLDSTTIAKFDADGDYLSEDVNFTFESVEMPEEFTDPAGMV